jgi:lipopolysaccharide export system permease protein
MQFLWKYIDDLAGKGLEWTVVAELMLYMSAGLVPMALPLAVLLSSIMTFGNLGENFELTAVKSAGVSLQRFMSPLIYLTIIICIAAFFYSDYVIPYTNLKTNTLIYDVKNQRPELQIKEGVFYNGIENYSIKIAEKDYKTNLLKNIMVYDHHDNQDNVNVTIADSGYMKMTADEKNLILTLYNGYSYEELKENRSSSRKNSRTYPHRRQNFEKQEIVFELTGFDLNRSDENLFKNHFRMLNLEQLDYAEDSLKNQLEEQTVSFRKTIATSSYFKKEDILVKDQSRRIRAIKKEEKKKIINDTVYSKKIIARIDSSSLNKVKFNADSVFNNLDNNSKESAIDHALTYARAAKNIITSSKTQINRKAEIIRRHQIEWHRKFALSFACLVFFFIGAPFGAIIRKGGFGTPVVISVLFFILYYIISISGEKFAREAVIPPYLGMWLSSFILMPLGIFLTYKATTDSVILNSDTYLLFFKKLIKRFSKKSE